MKKTLAIVLALAMVLCMIPASFADVTESKTITGKSYDMMVYSWEGKDYVTPALASKEDVNSITAEYNYETEGEDYTGQFTEDKKMAIVQVIGFDIDFTSDAEVTIDGKKLEVNSGASYQGQIGLKNAGSSTALVAFPVELTKAGYSDTYLVEVTETKDGKTLTETAKVSVKLVNTAAYKNAKTATISKIESNDKDMDAYIVGSKIYLDFVADAESYSGWYDQTVDITFKDDNGKLFSDVAWAYEVKNDAGLVMQPVGAISVNDKMGAKLDDSVMEYSIHSSVDDSKIKFTLETGSNIFETKEYSVVKRFKVVEADPKGIYFAESTKTIKIGEEYTPVVMGVATSKKIDVDKLEIGAGSDKQVIDIDGDTVIGTQEGVAYITASYTTNDGKPYSSSSMKIVVTAGEVEEDTDGAKYVVTASSLNVRSGAGTGYSKIGSLKNGAIVEVETIANGWAKLANGGYVSAQYLAKVVEDGEAVTMYVTCRTLNVRKGPGTSYAKAGTLSRGTAVQVVGMTGSWAKLSNGTYVSANYLSK